MKNAINSAASFAVLFAVSIALCQSAVIHVPADQPTIQAGIDAAVDGDTVLAADGTYTGDGNRDISFNGKAITVRSENGPETCIIDCEGIVGDHHRGFDFDDGEGPDSRLSGFTITGGMIDGGAGISCANASPTIDNCVITGNQTAWRGGGIYLFNTNALIADCIISDNLAFCDDPVPSDDVYGAGVFAADGSPVFVNCRIINNTSEQWLYTEAMGLAGGIYAWPATLINCLIAGNTANRAFGGGYLGGSSVLLNCTIVGNSGTSESGGVYCDSEAEIKRSIAWNNFPNSISGNPAVTYTDVQGGYAGEGNIDSDPIFVTSASGSYYLSQSSAGQSLDSPCIDAGDVSASDVCFETGDGPHCLNELSTRTDYAYDFDLADMGFHYPGPRCDAFGVSVMIADTHLEPGDNLIVAMDACNPTGSDVIARVYFVLEAYGQYFFRPAWTRTENYELVSLAPGLTTSMIFDFAWPATGTTGYATFIALMTNETGTAALGTWGLAGFNWQ